MATKRADQRRLGTTVMMTQELYSAVRDLAHKLGKTNSEVVVEALEQFLGDRYPEMWAQVAP